MVKRKQYDSQLLATVALEAVKNQKTIAQIGSDYSVHPNQVWSTDITYIRLSRGYIYLVAILDWFSRYVLSVVI